MNMLARLRSLFGRDNGEDRKTRERQKQAGLHPRGWCMASMEPLSTPTLLTKKQERQKVESLTTQLQLMTRQWNELRDRLILVTEGSLDNRPYHRPNPFYEKLKMEHKQVMSDLQRLENDNMEASQKISGLTKEKSFYFDLESRLLMEQSQLKKKVDILRQENRKLLEDWVLLKHHLGNMKLLSKDQEETSSLQKQQQQQHDILTPVHC